MRAAALRSAAATLLLTATACSVTACTATVDGTGTSARTSTGSAPRPSTSAPSSRPTPPQAPARFHDCRELFRLDSLQFPAGRADRLTFECARVSVPLDYARPSGRKIAVQLVRVHDSRNTGARRSLVVNPGGPGASGVELAVTLSARLSDAVLAKLDVVGFDPRGVGLSSPIRCLTDAQKDELNAASPNVLTPRGFAAARAVAKRFATACTRKYGSALPHFDTVDTARDLDRVRQALGDPRLTYLGFSYGTSIGSVYAHLFPSRVRALVLDGAVNPKFTGVQSFANQLQGFEKAFDQFAAYCRKATSCAAIGDPRSAVYRIASAADRDPIPSSAPGETRRATSALVYLGTLSALYSQSLWPTLGEALRSALDGDSAGLLALADRYNERYDGRYTNIADANLTIGCNDEKRGPSDATIRTTAREWKTAYPMFGLWSAASLFGCQQWQPVRNPPPLPTANTSANTVLVVGNRNDPATPYRGAEDLVDVMGKAELLTWDGEGHTSYLQGSDCVDRHVNAYLLRGTVPPGGTVCR